MMEALEIGNPFPGLRSFESFEEHLFFGREEQVDELLDRLQDHRFLAVLGASGSGKSSLVRTGLIPSLFAGYMVEAGSGWCIGIMRPGASPVANLAEALVQAGTEEIGELPPETRPLTEAGLRRGARGLVEATRMLRLPEGRNMLILVDQFEELFRFKQDTRLESYDEATAFVKLLLGATSQTEVPVYVVLTMRSDFLSNCTEFPGLAGAINLCSYLVPRMNRDQLRLAITGPVAVGGATIAPRLVGHLLNNLGDGTDLLPILQHSLMRTWDYWERNHEAGEPIDMKHYQAIGTMKEALSLHAEEAYMDLADERSRLCARKVFESLTFRDKDGKGIRRPTGIQEIEEISGFSRDDIIAVVESFRKPGRTFIMPPHGTELTDETVLDISHEALMRVWVRLRRWVEEAAQSARIYVRLATAARHHQNGTGGLWRDPELEMALRWREETGPTPRWARRHDPSFERAMLFLDQSREDRDLRQAHRAERRRRVARRIRMVAGIMTVTAVISILLALYALWAKNQADEAGRKAEIARFKAEAAQEDSERAREIAETRRKEAEKAKQRMLDEKNRADDEARKAKESARIAQENAEEAELQTQRAEKERTRAEKEKEEAAQARITAENERKRAETERDRADQKKKESERLRKLEMARTLAARALDLVGSQAELAGLLARQAYNYNLDNKGVLMDSDIHQALRLVLHELDAPAGQLQTGHRGPVRSLVFTGNRVLSGAEDGVLREWEHGDPLHRMMQVDGFDSAIRTMASTDDKGFWIGLFNGELVRMEIRDNRWVRAGNFNLNLPNGQGIRDLVLTPDGRGFGLVTTDGVVRVGQTDNPGKTTIPKDGLGEFTCIAFGPEGDLVAGGDQLVRWRDTAEEPTRPWSKNYITSVAFDLAGKFRAAGTRTGPILLWEGSDTVPRLLNGHASPVHTLSFSADGKMLASGSADRSIRLWLLDNPKARPLEYTGHQSWVWQVVFSPDGARIYSAGHDRTVRSWPVPVEELAERVCTLVRPELTREEWDLHVSPQLRHEQTCPTSPAENQPGGPQPYRP